MKNKIIYLFIIVVLISVFKIYSYNMNNKYETEEEYVYGLTAPRGRILDVNGNILVDNKQVKVIVANTYGLSEKDIIESRVVFLESEKCNIVLLEGEEEIKQYFIDSKEVKRDYIYKDYINGKLIRNE